MMAIYETKPQHVEAFQWTGDRDQLEDPAYLRNLIERGTVTFVTGEDKKVFMVFYSLEGPILVEQGDYIVHDSGTVYPMQRSLFESKYFQASDVAASGKVTLTRDEAFLFELERDPYTPTEHRKIADMFIKAGLNPQDPSMMVQHNPDGTMTFFKGE